MRKIEYIAVHCTATSQKTTIESIRNSWRVERGWKNPGYHYIIKASGEITCLLPEHEISNGVAGHNSATVNICYIGGIDTAGNPKDNRTPEQKASLVFLLEQLRDRYPKAIIQGHRDFPRVAKACPSFDAKTEYKNL